MKSSPAEIERILAVLDETPRRIQAATSRASRARLQPSSDKSTWSPADILAHLRACADLWTHSMYAMLAAATPSLPDLDERRWARTACFAEVPFGDSLQVFRLQRESLLRVLRALPADAWERAAQIAGRKHTVFTQARRLAKHEAEHCGQIEDLLKP